MGQKRVAVVAAAVALTGLLAGSLSSSADASTGFRIQQVPVPVAPSVCIWSVDGDGAARRTAVPAPSPATQPSAAAQPSATTQPSTSASGNDSVVIPAVAIVRVEGRTLRVTTNTGEPPAATDDFTVVGPGAGHTVSPQEGRRTISACARSSGR